MTGKLTMKTGQNKLEIIHCFNVCFRGNDIYYHALHLEKRNESKHLTVKSIDTFLEMFDRFVLANSFDF